MQVVVVASPDRSELLPRSPSRSGFIIDWHEPSMGIRVAQWRLQPVNPTAGGKPVPTPGKPGVLAMWRSFFLAIGIYLIIAGSECLAVDRVYWRTFMPKRDRIANATQSRRTKSIRRSHGCHVVYFPAGRSSAPLFVYDSRKTWQQGWRRLRFALQTDRAHRATSIRTGKQPIQTSRRLSQPNRMEIGDGGFALKVLRTGNKCPQAGLPEIPRLYNKIHRAGARRNGSPFASAGRVARDFAAVTFTNRVSHRFYFSSSRTATKYLRAQTLECRFPGSR